jgi:glycosyltransferase involved in cell wall biosynthesis
MLHTLRLPPILPSMTETLHFCKTQALPLEVVALSHTQAQLWQPYYPVSQGTLAFVGRIDPSKGVEDAIEVASQMGKTLSIYGAPQPYNTSYFEMQIQPLLQSYPNVLYHGLVDQQTLYQRLKHAQALLFPVKWEEPFGNVIIEAMAVGTPVVMYDRGSARELIAEGISGYVVSRDNVIEMASAVGQTETIDRSACADYTRERFSLRKSVKDYIYLLQFIC